MGTPPGDSPIVFDTGPLWSFAIVKRLDVLERRYGSRACRTLEVDKEISRNQEHVPALAPLLAAPWLGEPVQVSEIDPARSIELLTDVEQTRLALAGATAENTKNLGEASTIIAAREMSGLVAIEDNEGWKHARFRGLHALRTTDILQECVAMGDLACDEAVDIYRAMLAAGRRLPQGLSKRDICG